MNVYYMRRATHNDMEAIKHVAMDAYVALSNKGLFNIEGLTDDFIMKLIESGGSILVVESNNEIVAFLAGSYPGDTEDNLYGEVSNRPADWSKTVQLEFAAVKPKYQGDKLLTIMVRNYELDSRTGMKHIMCSVPVGNRPCVQQLAECGYRLEEIQDKAKALGYIMVKDL